MRENVLRDVAQRAVSDPGFLARLRNDVEGTLARYGYGLTDEELRLVQDLRRRTAPLSDEHLARLLAGGLERRSTDPPARPAAPGRNARRPARPARPGSGR